MKKKTFNKKMMLNKETVTNLDNDELQGINGGSWSPRCIPKSAGYTYCDDYTCFICISDDTVCDCPLTFEGPTCNN